MSTPEERIKEELIKFTEVIPYDDFTNLATSIAHQYKVPLAKATELIHKLRGNLEVGSQEFQNQGFGKNNLWQGQDAAHGFGMRAPGDLAEPKSSFRPLSSIELVAFSVGDTVRVIKNDQAPWGAEYKGVIVALNAQNTFDIRDLGTGVINEQQPARLLRNPLGEGRPDVRVQQRRVGDPKGLGEGQLDSGDPNVKRESPGMYQMPRGQEGKDVKNPQSLFYKEANSYAARLTSSLKDPLYSFLFNKIVKERGALIAADVMSYLEGKIVSPSRNLISILHQYNIVSSSLNVNKALSEVKDKTVEQINTETAWNWGSRAAACYQLYREATSEEEKDKWSGLGDDYRHEALEHAALVEDEGKLVGEVSRALAPFRKASNSHEGTTR